MKKVILCKPETKVETICHTDVIMRGSMIVSKIARHWYLLSSLPTRGKKCYWKQLSTSSQNWGGKYETPQEAIENVSKYKIYSFKSLDEFIKFYTEDLDG